MSDDLIARLRQGPSWTRTAHAMSAAADEIERLRTDVAVLLPVVKELSKECGVQADEIERLRRIVTQFGHTIAVLKADGRPTP